VYQFVCDRNVMYDAGKEDYLRPSEHIGLDWMMVVKWMCISDNKVIRLYDCVTPVNSRAAIL